MVGHVEALEATESGRYDVTMSYAIEAAAGELTQLLNVIFGNSAMHAGIRVLHFGLPACLWQQY